MKDFNPVRLKLLMSGRKVGKVLFMCSFYGPPNGKFVFFSKFIYYCDLHIWKCGEIFGYPLFEFLQTPNLFSHPMVDYIRRNEVLCRICFPLIKYFFNKPSSYCLVLRRGHIMSYNDQWYPLSFSLYLLKFSPNTEKCQSNIARHTRIPTITATINPTTPMIMSKFEPLLLLRIYSLATSPYY